jgi:hypothetical protein
MEESAGRQAHPEQRQPVARRKAVFRGLAPGAAAAQDAVLALLVLVPASQQVRLQVQQDEWVSRLVGAAAEQPVLVVAAQPQGPVAPLRPARKVQAREPVQAWVDALVVPPTVQDEPRSREPPRAQALVLLLLLLVPRADELQSGGLAPVDVRAPVDAPLPQASFAPLWQLLRGLPSRQAPSSQPRLQRQRSRAGACGLFPRRLQE